MPKRNDAERRAQRKIAALQRSGNPNELLLATVAGALQQIRLNEESRLCDACKLPKWECEILAEHDETMSHIFSPMSPQDQLALEEQRSTWVDEPELVFYADIDEPEREMRNQHFSGHAVDCTMSAPVCYINAGISGR